MLVAGSVQAETHLQSREHLTLFFAVKQAVMVLHGHEGREVMRDGVVYQFPRSVAATATRSLWATHSAWHGLDRAPSVSGSSASLWRSDSHWYAQHELIPI